MRTLITILSLITAAIFTSCSPKTLPLNNSYFPMPNYVGYGNQITTNGNKEIASLQVLRYADCVWLILKDSVETIHSIFRFKEVVLLKGEEIYVYQTASKEPVFMCYYDKEINLVSLGIEINFYLRRRIEVSYEGEITTVDYCASNN